MLLFFNAADQRLFLFSILSLVEFFFMELHFCPHFPLFLVYLWVWCLMLSLMFRLVLLIVVPEALCKYVLTCTILVRQLSKSSVLSPRPSRAYMGSIA